MESTAKKRRGKTRNQRATEKSIAQVWADLNRGHDKVGEIIKESARIIAEQKLGMRRYRAAIPLKSKRLTKTRGRAKPKSRWQELVLEHGVKRAQYLYRLQGGKNSGRAKIAKERIKNDEEARLKKYSSRPKYPA